jgi:hypothetical protein
MFKPLPPDPNRHQHSAIAQSFVAKYEGGERRIDVVEFLEIAEVLQADPNAIVRKLRNLAP